MEWETCPRILLMTQPKQSKINVKYLESINILVHNQKWNFIATNTFLYQRTCCSIFAAKSPFRYHFIFLKALSSKHVSVFFVSLIYFNKYFKKRTVLVFCKLCKTQIWFVFGTKWIKINYVKVTLKIDPTLIVKVLYVCFGFVKT